MGDGVLVGAIVVHLPDIFVGSGDFDVEDFGFGDARSASAETEDDLISEAMGDLAGGGVAGVLVVLLGKHLGVLLIFCVKQKPVAGDPAALDAEAAEGDHGGCRWRGCPLLEVDVGRSAWVGLGQQALGDDVEDAGVGQIGEKRRVEGGLQAAGLWVRGVGLEVGNSDADRSAFGGFSLDYLCTQSEGRGEQEEQSSKAIKLSVPNRGRSFCTMHSILMLDAKMAPEGTWTLCAVVIKEIRQNF